ncbi:MAG TPA: fumarylacetoacetate hydrolase family protein [Bacteroidaceae bacterium]|nr:fumarylacetoacetate hydrolase family protein [Bacteroidaceae bacterium]
MKIICIGMNYSGHNNELGNTLIKQTNPVVFLKPDSAILRNRRPFFLPDFSNRIEYETEIVIRIDKLGKNIDEKFAYRYWDVLTVGIDFTARDMQEEFRSEGLPWELCKAFDSSAVIGDFVPKERYSDAQSLHFNLNINGETVQKGYTGDMTFSIEKIISFVSCYFTLRTGDLIFTGTPAGIGPTSIGQHFEGYIEEDKLLDFHIR